MLHTKVLKKLGLTAGTGGIEATALDQDSFTGELGQSAMAMPATQVWAALFACHFPRLQQECNDDLLLSISISLLSQQKLASMHAVPELHDIACISHRSGRSGR